MSFVPFTVASLPLQASILGDFLLNALGLLAGDAAGNKVYSGFELGPVRPDPTTRRQASEASLATEAAVVAVTHTLEEQLLTGLANPVGFLTALPAFFPVAATLGLARGADYLKERVVVHLLQAGALSGERRGDLSATGQLLQLALHEGLQVGAFAMGLGCMQALGIGDWGFFGGDLGVGLQALLVSLGRDAARFVGQQLFPKVYAARGELKAKQRHLDVYTRYRPLRPRLDTQGIAEWRNFVQKLNFFEGGRENLRLFSGQDRLHALQRASEAAAAFRGFAFFVADTQPARQRYRKNPEAFLSWLFTSEERTWHFAQKIIADRAKNPQKQAGRITDLVEVKRAIWTFLMGEAPRSDRAWDPHEIEVALGETGLASFKLSPRLQARMRALGASDIQSTFTDSGEISLGIVSFRSRAGAGPILSIGIDCEDTRRFLRHSEPRHETWYDPGLFFPEESCAELFANGRRPSAVEIARRHVVSESLFKASWPHLPQAHHGSGLYQQFGLLDDLRSGWQTLKLSGAITGSLERWGARHAETRTTQIGDAMLGVTILASPVDRR